MPERTIAIHLTPTAAESVVLLDGVDISAYLRGVVVRASVDDGTSVELIPTKGHRVELVARLPEASIVIRDEG